MEVVIMWLINKIVSQEDNEIHLITFYLCGYLLYSSQMSGKKLVYANAGCILNESTCSMCRINIML